ncbi:MAG: DUF4837 family protein [Saprospiraceae bacterium]|nr:DUF4837 family protein [Saprospiraceae bacterium]
MSYRILFSGILITGLLALTSCQNTIAGLQSKPTALGKTSELVVVCDQPMWDGAVGDSLIFYYESPYPIMPQPEPMFDVRHFTTDDLNADALRKELRTYLVIGNLSDEDSPTTNMIREDLGPEKMRRAAEDPAYFTSVGQDKWARGQLIMYLFGKSDDDIIDKLIRSFPTIAQRINQHDKVQVNAATYLDGENVPMSTRVREKFGVELKIPGDFKLAVDRENFLWVRKDTRELTSSIAIRAFDYTDKNQLELDGLINMRDRLGILVQGSSVGSFMRTNAEDLPVYTYQKELGGRYVVESRGIWELTEDFLGGPFLNYAIIDGNRILMIDCFVFAPGTTKRKYVQQLEHVVSSLKFAG